MSASAIRDLAWSGLRALLIAVVAVIWLAAVLTIGPRLEAMLFPVYTDWQITGVEKQSDERSNIWVRFTKVRECEFIGLSWYWGDEVSGFRRVYVDFNRPRGDNSDPTRPLGRQIDGPWIVSIPAETVFEESRVDVHHRCHAAWVTRTHLYP